MYSTIIFLSFGIIILSVMLSIEIDIMIDCNKLKIPVVIKVFGIKIIKVNINIFSFQCSINNGKNFELLKVISKEEKYIISQIKSSILDKLYYDRIEINGKIGLSNADVIALSVGVLQNIMLITKHYFAIKNDVDFNYSVKANFENEETNFQINIRVLFTIFDMIFGIILSLYRRGKYAKQK